MAAALRHDGGPVTLQNWPDFLHAWQILDGYFPEARQALHAIATFVESLGVSLNSGSTGPTDS